ncbi:MAG TPA: PQQ-binding-like beta-propeller repeat protein [Patescibacteria group bacterium]|nr:PQQ-binding-like beta-propeller repeat protein [Patescibacteria group bacterium]
MRRITVLFLISFFISLAPAAFAGAQPARSAGKQAASAPKKTEDAGLPASDWPDADRGPAAMLFSPLTQITPENVAHLTKVCSYTFPAKQQAEFTPAVWDGVIYAASANYTVALDGSNCHVKWLDHWKPRDIQRSGAQRGAIYADGKIIRGTSDGYLVVMNATNGRVVWARRIANPHDGYSITMSPIVYDGLIYVGPAGAEAASSGWVGAYKLSNGALAWKFHVVPLDGQPGAETWGPNPAARAHGGGNVWTEYGLDPAHGLLYVPGGNAAPDFYSKSRPGANLYTNSLIVLDAKTGHLVWYHQFIPHDTHDYDTNHATPIFETKIDGKTQPLVASTGKDGVLSVLNRDTHQLVYSVPFTTQLNNQTPLTTKPTRVCPGSLGGDEWSGPAYDLKLNLLIVDSLDWCTTEWAASKEPSVKFAHSGGLYFGGGRKFDPWSKAHGWIVAIDASTGKVVWRHRTREPQVAGLAVTASNLLFTGELGGNFDALNAKTGKVLYQYQVGDQIEGGVSTYLASGRQYVAIVSGLGFTLNATHPPLGGGNPTVTVFGLKR